MLPTSHRETRSPVARASVLVREMSRTPYTASSSVAAAVRNAVTQTSLGRRELPASSAGTSLLDGTGDGEDRHVHRDQESADHGAEEDHEQRLDHRGQA